MVLGMDEMMVPRTKNLGNKIKRSAVLDISEPNFLRIINV